MDIEVGHCREKESWELSSTAAFRVVNAQRSQSERELVSWLVAGWLTEKLLTEPRADVRTSWLPLLAFRLRS